MRGGIERQNRNGQSNSTGKVRDSAREHPGKSCPLTIPPSCP